MHSEMPQMLASSYASSTTTADLLGAAGLAQRRIPVGNAVNPNVAAMLQQLQPQKEPVQMANQTRVIRVYVADTDENLEVEKRLLYTGDEKLTDATDQELFYDVPINDLLSKHNEFRKTITDKKQSEKFGRDVKLEPIRIRDLKMTIVTIASF